MLFFGLWECRWKKQFVASRNSRLQKKPGDVRWDPLIWRFVRMWDCEIFWHFSQIHRSVTLIGVSPGFFWKISQSHILTNLQSQVAPYKVCENVRLWDFVKLSQIHRSVTLIGASPKNILGKSHNLTFSHSKENVHKILQSHILTFQDTSDASKNSRRTTQPGIETFQHKMSYITGTVIHIFINLYPLLS